VRTFVVEAPGRRRGKKRRRRYHQAHHGRRTSTTPNLVHCHGALDGDGVKSGILTGNANCWSARKVERRPARTLGRGKALETRWRHRYDAWHAANARWRAGPCLSCSATLAPAFGLRCRWLAGAAP
jgi:hypothetical protein